MTTASWTGRVPAGAVAEAATALARAQTTGRPIEPVRSVIGDSDIPSAYAVQRELVRMRTEHGAVVVGRKIGLTSAAVQRQLGVDQPDFGVLFADMDVDRKSTRLNSSHVKISYAVFCLKKKKFTKQKFWQNG